MKKISILLAILLILAFPFSAHAQITKDQYYARSTLEGNELEFYDERYDSFSKGDTERHSNFGLSNDRASQIAQYVWNDAPELFRQSNFYTYEEAAEYQTQIDQKTDEIISNIITDGMTDYEKVEAIYNFVKSSVRYGESEEAGDEGQTIVGALLYNQAVCAGISRAFQYLLYKIDIPCYCVESDVHGWNIVQVDGKWYNTDLTEKQRYPNGTFLLSDEVFYKAHQAPDMDINPSLPECPDSYGDVMYYNYKTQRYEVVGEEEPEPTAEPTIEPTPARVVADVEPQEPPADGNPGGPNWTGWLVIAVAVIVGMRALQVIVSRKKKK